MRYALNVTVPQVTRCTVAPHHSTTQQKNFHTNTAAAAVGRLYIYIYVNVGPTELTPLSVRVYSIIDHY